MTTDMMTSKLAVRWMSFDEHTERIMRLRRRVYCDEQGFSEDVTASERDKDALHLGMFHDDDLISAITAYIHELDQETATRLHLPFAPGNVVQYGKRVQPSSYRGSRFGQFIVSTMLRNVHEL